MNEQDRTSIHEAMEQQSISVSKAGIVTTLSARCSVIAAANPIGGRYDESLTFSENVDLTDPILSRFDIIVVMKDKIEPDRDGALADFVARSHIRSHPTDPEEVDPIPPKKQGAEEEPPIDQELLKKYILYARTTVFPVIADVNHAKIARFYSEIRSESFNTGGVPMTVRHLESIVRIAQSHARMELRDFVSAKDVDNAIAVMLRCFIQTQRHAIAEKLKQKFARYLVVSADQSSLCKYLLEKELKRAFSLGMMLATGETAQVDLATMLKIAESLDLKDAFESFVQSDGFREEYQLEDNPPHRVITKL